MSNKHKRTPNHSFSFETNREKNDAFVHNDVENDIIETGNNTKKKQNNKIKK